MRTVLLFVFKIVRNKKLIAASYPTGCDAKFCYNCKRENRSNEKNDESYSPPPGIGFTFRGVICRYCSKQTSSNF